MNFTNFVSSLVHFLHSHHDISVVVNLDAEDGAFLSLTQDGQDFYVGNNTDPGAFVEWIGRQDLKKNKSEYLVCVNGIVLSANGRAVAGFIAGFQ